MLIPLLGGKVSEAFSPLDPRSKWLTFSVTASRWLNDHTPLGSVLAMGDRAGALAYLTDRPIVQREGIVNSKRDLNAVENEQVPAFLAARYVSYVIDWTSATNPMPASVPGAPGCRPYPFTLGTGRRSGSLVLCDRDRVYAANLHGELLSVWRYRSALQARAASTLSG